MGRDKAFQEYTPNEQRRSLPGAELDRDLEETLGKLEKSDDIFWNKTSKRLLKPSPIKIQW